MAQKERMQWQAMLSTIGLHVGLIVLIYGSSIWVFHTDQKPSSGEPVLATLSFSTDDLAKAKQSLRKAELAAQDMTPPEPSPQTGLVPQQQTAQEWVDNPDQINQEKIVNNALQPSEKQHEQSLKQKQTQVELTEVVKKDTAEEHRQRLIKIQIDAVKKERIAVAKQAQLAEQRLDALAAESSAPNKMLAMPLMGQHGVDDSQRSKYIAAVNATARSNWNTMQIPEQTRCQVEFTQIRPGQVIDVNFLKCPLDSRGRESVERALYKTPMPYAGFEAVFQRKVVLTFCYPNEVCQ
jgi:colicin import membrane protein